MPRDGLFLNFFVSWFLRFAFGVLSVTPTTALGTVG
jgi:hypothetical protein